MTSSEPPKTSPIAASSWLAIIGAAIGIIVGIIVAGALSLSGLTSASLPELPTLKDHATPTPIARPSATPSPTSTAPQPELTSRHTSVAPGQRFDLSGQLPSAKPGTELQIQVRDGSSAWTDFPVTAEVKDDGTFYTEVYTTRTGSRVFRLIDLSTGKATPTLTIKIG